MYSFLIISKLSSKSTVLSEREIKYLCEKSKDIFKEQPMLLEVTAPLIICGISTINQVIYMDNTMI
jgi:serine/threonine-protein phosphatase PP1 catalytic subunit